MKLTIRIALFASLLLSVPVSHAQAIFAARQYFRLEAGAGAMYLHNDYSARPADGIAMWADCDLTHYKAILIGAEAEVHLGNIITPDDIGETSYLIGPRFSYTKRRVSVYGKLLLGRATITNQETDKSSSFNVVPAYGGGVEYHLNRHINIRAIDFEMQKWPNFEPNTLSPVSVTIGASYVIFPSGRRE